jgi:hypothetical protein
MWMKPITALLLLSLAGVGAGCSLTTPAATAEAAPAEASPAAEVTQTAEVQGTLNLNIGRTNDAPGGLKIGAGPSSSSGGLIVGPGGAGGDFEDVEGLGIDLEDAPEALLQPEPASDEDEIVRLPPEN